MKANEFRLKSEWHLKGGSTQQVFDLLIDPQEIARWWPASFLEVELLSQGDDKALGRRARFKTTGWLPIVQDWTATIVEAERPARIRIRASGDFSGEGLWLLSEEPDGVRASLEWNVRV